MQGEENNNVAPQSGQQPTPGLVISPNSAPVANNTYNAQPVVSAEQSQMPQSVESGDPAPQQTITQGNSAQEFNDSELNWIGPEFVAHDKSSKWYATCVIAAIVLGGIMYAIVQDFISSFTIALAIIIVGFYSMRKPKDRSYTLNETGIAIGDKSFLYEEFRSFTANHESVYLNINLIPIKRFSPPTGLCYSGQDGDKLIDFLSARLPMQEYKPDILDDILQRIRF